jgi:hypothetical protein
MLNHLDNLLQRLLDAKWAAPPKPGFAFTAPTDEWRARVKAGAGERLSIYLYELRENAGARRAEWDSLPQPDGSTIFARPPASIDCHYIISAWSAAEDSEALTPMLDEHRVLAEALRILLANPEVVPAERGMAVGGPVFLNSQVTLTVAAPEPARVLNDFWTTMKQPWRPAIQLVATAPLDLLVAEPPAPAVLTLVQRYLLVGGGGVAEERISAGGYVLRAADDSPLARASVRHLVSGVETLTDARGRFLFDGLARGSHALRVTALGFAPREQSLDLPDGPPTQHFFRLA